MEAISSYPEPSDVSTRACGASQIAGFRVPIYRLSIAGRDWRLLVHIAGFRIRSRLAIINVNRPSTISIDNLNRQSSVSIDSRQSQNRRSAIVNLQSIR
jgi:hypothetical protein